MESIYLFVIYLIPVAIGMVTLSASAYGIGKYEKNNDATEYKVSLVFFIIGLVVSTVSLMYWFQGNYFTGSYKTLLDNSQDLAKKASEATEELGNCKKQKIDLELEQQKKAIETKVNSVTMYK